MAIVIVDHNIDVVENIVVVRGAVVSWNHTCVFWVAFLVDIATHWEPCRAVSLAILNRVAPGDRHVVNNPVMLVVHEHPLLKQGQLFLVLWLGGLVLLGAENLALVYVLPKGYLIRGRSNPLTKHHLQMVRLYSSQTESKYVKYGLTCPRFSWGAWLSSALQKSKWWYSYGITDSSLFKRFTNNFMSFEHVVDSWIK